MVKCREKEAHAKMIPKFSTITPQKIWIACWKRKGDGGLKPAFVKTSPFHPSHDAKALSPFARFQWGYRPCTSSGVRNMKRHFGGDAALLPGTGGGGWGRLGPFHSHLTGLSISLPVSLLPSGRGTKGKDDVTPQRRQTSPPCCASRRSTSLVPVVKTKSGLMYQVGSGFRATVHSRSIHSVSL